MNVLPAHQRSAFAGAAKSSAPAPVFAGGGLILGAIDRTRRQSAEQARETLRDFYVMEGQGHEMSRLVDDYYGAVNDYEGRSVLKRLIQAFSKQESPEKKAVEAIEQQMAQKLKAVGIDEIRVESFMSDWHIPQLDYRLRMVFNENADPDWMERMLSTPNFTHDGHQVVFSRPGLDTAS